MKRAWLALLVFGAMVVSAFAEPKVTISGFVDNITAWSHNLSLTDANFARNHDTEWYARTRVRPDIVAEVGTTKFVLGLEIDATYGQTANQDTNVCLHAACPAAAGAAQRLGSSCGFDVNTYLPR